MACYLGIFQFLHIFPDFHATQSCFSMLNPSPYDRSSTAGQQHGEAVREIAEVVLSTCPQHIVLLLEKNIGEFLLEEFAAKFGDVSWPFWKWEREKRDLDKNMKRRVGLTKGQRKKTKFLRACAGTSIDKVWW